MKRNKCDNMILIRCYGYVERHYVEGIITQTLQ